MKKKRHLDSKASHLVPVRAQLKILLLPDKISLSHMQAKKICPYNFQHGQNDQFSKHFVRFKKL